MSDSALETRAWPAGAACVPLSLALLLAAAAAASLATWGPSTAAAFPWQIVFAAAWLAQGCMTLLAWRRGGLTARQVLAVAVLLRLCVLWLPPGASADGWRYVWDGLVQLHGVGPYAHEPRDAALAFLQVRHGDLYERLNSAAFYSVYPPLTQLVFAAGAVPARLGAPPLAGVYVIKLVFAAAEVGGLFLLSRMVSPRALMLYAWHPLVVFESAGQPHGESLMAALLVACLWLSREPTRRNRTLAGAALGAAVMVKLYPLALLPFLWRRLGLASVLGATAVMLALALPYASPEAAANVRDSLGLYVGFFDFNAPPFYLLRDFANWAEPSETDMGKLLVGQLLQTSFACALPILLWLDWRRRWPLAQAFAAVIGFYLICSTTVHPWYLLGLLALPCVVGDRPQWHWLWLGLLAGGTYLAYAPAGWANAAYLTFVWLGWGGWLALLLLPSLPRALQAALRLRGRRKAGRVAAHLPQGGRLLDLGGGEGYVGQALAKRLGATVTLADVADLRRADVPAVLYDGRRLPFADDAFDGVILYFVLHHAERPKIVLAEALRVCRPGGRVVVVESVYRRAWERRLLDRLDRLANRLRGGALMAAQEPHLRFRRARRWRRLAEQVGGRAVSLREHGRPPHRQATLVLAPGDTWNPAVPRV